MEFQARILNVDDEESARYVKNRILSRAGFEVIDATSGVDALAMVHSHRPELVLLDVNMPDINGMEVCRRLKADPATRSILVLQISAALVDSADRVRALDSGADSYLVAPIAPEELVANVKALLRLSRVEEAYRLSQNRLLESESRFKQMAESISDVFWMIDLPERTLSYISPAAASLWERSEEELYADWNRRLKTLTPEDRESIDHAESETSAGARCETEYRIRRPDATIKWISERTFPIADDDGRIYRLAGVAQDITERKFWEQRLQEADRRKDEFLAMLAHELRNPLGPIRNAVEVMHNRPYDITVQNQLRQMIERQVSHLAHLVDDLLDVARITQGHIPLRTEPVALRQFVTAAIETCAPLIEERQHQLDISLPDNVWIEGDAVRLAQIVGNLLNNAAKYTPDGGRISVEAKVQGQYVAIVVRDNGEGISADLLPNIFDLFTQAERTLDRSRGGLGIGLSLVKKLVELHGGTIVARSPGAHCGSEFELVFPTILHTPAPTRAPAVHSFMVSHLRRILIIDDSEDSTEAMSLLLRSDGHDVAVAHNGVDGLALARSFEPNVVLIDIGLPGMDGYSVAEKLRQMDKACDAMLVAVTGYGQASDRARSIQAGFDHHLVKPVNPETLSTIINA